MGWSEPRLPHLAAVSYSAALRRPTCLAARILSQFLAQGVVILGRVSLRTHLETFLVLSAVVLAGCLGSGEEGKTGKREGEVWSQGPCTSTPCSFLTTALETSPSLQLDSEPWNSGLNLLACFCGLSCALSCVHGAP